MNPTALVGYGGFNVSYPLHFSPRNWAWIERGGIYAVANIRGGGEYGEAWHRAGMLDKKENCFNDFADAMRWLITEKYASPATIGIMGGSNGGLLTGALVTREPQLFKAALVAVPLLDMLRFHKFLIGRYWVSEYGSADDPEQFKWLYRYSPYHQVTQGTRYPAVLLTAGEHDSRVHPLHAKKMAAALQWANGSHDPILLYVDTKAGHGQGKGTEMRIAEAAMEWAFFMDQLGLK
jgi:prolyl oligopeptidase